MKFLVSILALVAGSVASAEAVTDWNALANPPVNVVDPHPYMRCEPQLYNCGTYWAEVDFCENGSYYLRGTDIPFRCENLGD